MTEVACAVCGAVYRFAPAEIPPAGKTLTCAKCKARVVVPGAGAATPAMAGGAGDVIDLADLPAPRRVAAPSKSRADDGIDLPMPSLSTADLGLDLPAPKGPAGRVPGKDPLTLDSIDLLAPVGPRPRGAGPPPVGVPIDLPGPGVTDLPAPKRPSGMPDLPAPKRASTTPRVPDLPDLPAPKRPAARPPARPVGGGVPDLPAPKRASAPTASALFDDLPSPRGRGIGDLPAPKRPSDVLDLPTPKRPSDLPDLLAPKRPSDLPDLLEPVGPVRDLPAPKGYFADLPQPKSATATSSSTDVAPKGFFADLPQPKSATATSSSTDVAPKGFFDDLPQAKAATPSVSTDVAPKGFFDDLPSPSNAGVTGTAPESGHNRSASLDLDGLDLAPPADRGIDLSPPAPGGLELQPAVDSARSVGGERPAPGTNPPPLELGDVDALPGLDLPAPSAGGGRVVSFKPAAGDELDPGISIPNAPSEIDLAVARRDAAGPRDAARPARDAAGETPKPGLSKKLQRLLLVGGLVLAVVGGGGYLYYQRWEAKQQRASDIRAALEVARRSMNDGGKNSWQRAANAARQVIALDKRHPEALGLAAQALLAGYIDEGTQGDARRTEARKHLAAVPAGSGRTPAVERAIALDLIVDGDADAAITRLAPLAARKDADAILFLGWAQLGAALWDDAIASFQAALAASPERVVTATYGLARAQLGKGEREAARTSFLGVIAADKEHVGALVGEAEAMPPNDFVQREAALLAILQRKGLDHTDPRVVARAWRLAGDDARRAGRLDTARERYRKALAIVPTAVGALVSSASLELRDNQLDAAAELVDRALALAGADVRANLVAAELDIKRSRLTDAGQRLASLRERTPPLAGPTLGRLHLLEGMRLEADKQPDAALQAYEQASQVLGENEVEPAIATAMLLGRMAQAARAARNEARAVSLEARAAERLGTLSVAAESDPALAVTLGVTYLAAGSAAESEAWLRKAVARRPGDVEANFQLAEALRRQGKQDEALATLVKAFELDPTRIDLGVELARGFEAAGKDEKAAALYQRLVDVPSVTLDVRMRAGRFFARTRDVESARKQGDKILEIEAGNATGMYLHAEGLLADGHVDEARRNFQLAADIDPDAQFLDGLGRALEDLAARTGDTARRDEALRAYVQASDKDPKMLNPRLGRGRLHMARKEHAKALAAFQEALELAPGEPSIPYGIGVSFAELGERTKAIEWLNRSVKAQPRADAYYRLGVIHYDMNNGGAAAAALSRATDLGIADERAQGVTVPWLTDALWLLGETERVRGNRSGQCRAWRSYLERNPTNRVQSDEVRRDMFGCR